MNCPRVHQITRLIQGVDQHTHINLCSIVASQNNARRLGKRVLAGNTINGLARIHHNQISGNIGVCLVGPPQCASGVIGRHIV